jgi:hypothetical protein
MTDKQKIADLEKRVKDLEARPVAPTIIVLPENPYPTVPQYPQPWTWPWWPQPITWECNTSAGIYPKAPYYGNANLTAGGALECPGITFTSSSLYAEMGLS